MPELGWRPMGTSAYLTSSVMVMLESLPLTCDDTVCDELQPASLSCLAGVSKMMNSVVWGYQRRSFNITRTLSLFMTVEEAFCFRVLQAKTGMIIIGSVVVQFMDRAPLKDIDLDVAVGHEHSYEVGRWLCLIGYQFQSDLGPAHSFAEAHVQATLGMHRDLGAFGSPLFWSRVASVFTFRHILRSTTIHLISAEYSPLDVILASHSTCVMNFITHEQAVSLYPFEMFHSRWSLVCNTVDSMQETSRQKYVRRGWTMVKSLTYMEIINPKSEFRTRNRFVGDDNTWALSLEPAIPYPSSSLSANSWHHGYGLLRGGTLTSEQFSAPGPSNRYLLANDSEYLDFIQPMCVVGLTSGGDVIETEDIVALLNAFNSTVM
ncbi:hypothetical protein Hypma_009674 [Hypsizygus marmoreus]|uniref:F-box domain-containing protein n=1 Tax=Hypsizygus marmoreus TaxID=39966 RepID=A0A369JU08_HYPMA|nr:hypothetical protein Hypma_009674 [Hypsizygus marmoreus]